MKNHSVTLNFVESRFTREAQLIDYIPMEYNQLGDWIISQSTLDSPPLFKVISKISDSIPANEVLFFHSLNESIVNSWDSEFTSLAPISTIHSALSYLTFKMTYSSGDIGFRSTLESTYYNLTDLFASCTIDGLSLPNCVDWMDGNRTTILGFTYDWLKWFIKYFIMPDDSNRQYGIFHSFESLVSEYDSNDTALKLHLIRRVFDSLISSWLNENQLFLTDSLIEKIHDSLGCENGFIPLIGKRGKIIKVIGKTFKRYFGINFTDSYLGKLGGLLAQHINTSNRDVFYIRFNARTEFDESGDFGNDSSCIFGGDKSAGGDIIDYYDNIGLIEYWKKSNIREDFFQSEGRIFYVLEDNKISGRLGFFNPYSIPHNILLNSLFSENIFLSDVRPENKVSDLYVNGSRVLTLSKSIDGDYDRFSFEGYEYVNSGKWSEKNEEYYTCYSCGCRMHEDEIFMPENGDNFYCENCYYRLYKVCEVCDNTFYKDDMNHTLVNNEMIHICDDCLSNLMECENCENHQEDLTNTSDGYICDNCLERYYIECTDCGDIVRNAYSHMDENGLCNDCARKTCEYCGDKIHPSQHMIDFTYDENHSIVTGILNYHAACFTALANSVHV